MGSKSTPAQTYALQPRRLIVTPAAIGCVHVFHGTTANPMCPRQCGGSASVPRCQRSPMLPQNSPSQSHRRDQDGKYTWPALGDGNVQLLKNGDTFQAGHIRGSSQVLEFGRFSAELDRAKATLLDVRGAAEYAELHLPGAFNIAHTRLGPRLAEISTSRPVVVHCRSGNRAALAMAYLEREGYKATLIDGMLASWPR